MTSSFKNLFIFQFSADISQATYLPDKDKPLIEVLSWDVRKKQLDINKFNKQYPTLKVARTNKFHDRFIVIDNKELYHCGASLKDLGKKCFAVNKMEDVDFIKNFENLIN